LLGRDVWWWVVVGVFTAPIWGSLAWVIWQGSIRPRLIPAAEIEEEARRLLSRCGDRAAEMVFIEEDRAWRYSESFEQGRWRRVRRTIDRLQSDLAVPKSPALAI
jgi:hypothetical protein